MTLFSQNSVIVVLTPPITIILLVFRVKKQLAFMTWTCRGNYAYVVFSNLCTLTWSCNVSTFAVNANYVIYSCWLYVILPPKICAFLRKRVYKYQFH